MTDHEAFPPPTPPGTDDMCAALTFIVPQDTKPYFESSALTGGEPRVHFETEARRADVRDMRRIPDLL